jgi:hypothetical protein
MGGSSSKQLTPTGPSSAEAALQKAAFVPEAIAQQLQQQTESARLAAEQAAAAATAKAGSAWRLVTILGSIFGIVIAALIGIYIYDYFALQRCGQTILLPPQASKECFTATQAKDTKPVLKTGPPSLFTKLTSTVTGSDSSGDLVSSAHDASTSMTIPASSAPLSNQTQGAYSMQWWMFVNDWNYGYGKEKPVIQRSDPTNTQIMNPSVSLHPTDNTLKISVSVFADGEGSSKTEPAPATGSGSSTDDVYTCEVTNIPLQSWFSVGMSVFGRNLDVYIDGKLVKSCFLSGVPKPATGEISVTPDGGYSGYLCNLYTYPRMLTPGDAMNFFSAGSSCQNITGTSTAANLTGYSVKFGVYNPQGKEIQEYTF